MSEGSTKSSRTTKAERKRRKLALGSAWQMCSTMIREDLRTRYGVNGDLRRLDDYCEGERGIQPETKIRDLCEYARQRGMDKERMRSHLRNLGDHIVERVYASQRDRRLAS